MLWGMQNYLLPEKDLKILRIAHKGAQKKKQADRIKAIYLLGSGWSLQLVHEALLLDEDTLRNYFWRYQQGGLMGLLDDKYLGNQGQMTNKELRILDVHLQEVTYRTAKEVVEFVKSEFEEEYSISGMHALLRRLGFSYKKPQRKPGRCDIAEQEKFIKKYNKIRKNIAEGDHILFMDTTHPTYNPVVSYGWIKRGFEKLLSTTSAQPRLNIHGAIDIDRLEMVVNIESTMVNAESVKDFLELIRKKIPKGKIYLFCDRAAYYKNPEVEAYAKSMAIEMEYLPPYSPNLNLIERVWLFFKKKTVFNRYYVSFDEFELACKDFFSNLHQHKESLRSLLTENFQRFKHA
jgi:transposase